MPPKGKSKQPTITAALTGSSKKRAKTVRRIAASSESECSDDEVEEVTPTKRGRGRPRKEEAKELKPLFDKSYDKSAWSLCVEKKGTHLPMVWFNAVCDWLEAKMELYDASTEIGPKAGHRHLQAVGEGHVLSDEDGIKRMKNEIKASMGVRWGDGAGALVYLKELVEGQTVPRMIGYVRKDRNLSSFNNRNKGVTQEMIDAGIAEHTACKLSFTDNKILVTKANIFNKAYVKWTNEIAPRKVMFSEIMTMLLNDKAHILSATVLMNSNGQMRRSAAEVYWALVMGKEVTEYEVRHMLYLPKNAFSGHEYVPYDMPAKNTGLFGDSDDEEGGEGGEEVVEDEGVQVEEEGGAGPSGVHD